MLLARHKSASFSEPSGRGQVGDNQYFTCRPRTQRPTWQCCNAQETHGTNEFCVIHLDKTHGPETNVPSSREHSLSSVSLNLTLSTSSSNETLCRRVLIPSLLPDLLYHSIPGSQEVEHSVSPCKDRSAYFCTPQTERNEEKQRRQQTESPTRS